MRGGSESSDPKAGKGDERFTQPLASKKKRPQKKWSWSVRTRSRPVLALLLAGLPSLGMCHFLWFSYLSVALRGNREERQQQDLELKIKQNQQLHHQTSRVAYEMLPYEPGEEKTKTMQPPRESKSDMSCLTPNATLVHFKRKPLPLPIINLSLPKTGTTTLGRFFVCGGHKIKDWWCDDMTCGECIKRAVDDGLPPLATCGGANVTMFAQFDVTDNPRICHWPQIQNLQQIHEENPNATFILASRDVKEWIRSVKAWNVYGKESTKKETMVDQLRQCSFFSEAYSPEENDANQSQMSIDEALEKFYCDHVHRVRQFVESHPSHTLVEIKLASRTVHRYLGRLFDIQPRCWKMHNANPDLAAQRA